MPRVVCTQHHVVQQKIFYQAIAVWLFVSLDCLVRTTLRPFRPHCQMDAHKANEIWKSLSRAMCEIYNKNASVLSFEELYRCTHEVVHSCDVLTIGMLTILCCISMEIYCTMVFRRWWRLTFIQYVSSAVLVCEFILFRWPS